MNVRQSKLTIGTRIHWDGEPYRVTGFSGSAIVLRSSSGRSSQVALVELAAARDFRIDVSDAPAEHTEVVTFLDSVPEGELTKAKELLGHLLEARTGYQRGSAASALIGEPRAEFDPEFTTLMDRVGTKANELGLASRTLRRLLRRFDSQGLYGLVDHRSVKLGGDRLDPRIKQAISVVLDEITYESNVSKLQLARRTARKLKDLFPDADLAVPPKSTFNRLVDQLSRGRGTFGASKARRSIANRPSATYSHFFANRPGEMVLIDSTPLDAFAVDPNTFEWVQVQLTIAYDLYSRSIIGWRFTPVSTKGVDAALLLYDILRPKLMQRGWPESARWAYIGVPENIVVELVGKDGDGREPLAGIPFLHPESVLVDHGKVFLSQAFSDACTRLGINLFLARPYTPTDKAHVERVFRAIRESFVENLPGYRGPDLFSRGERVEEGAFFFMDELDALFAEWVASYWQRRHHDGLELPHVPKLHVSPNEMYEEGIARAGFVYLVPDERMYYELLPTEWRTVQHYGVEVRGLRYDGDILDDFRNQSSPYSGRQPGKWPLRYDPRDYSRIFFYDHSLDQWHTLYWNGYTQTPRPFDEATLSYAKSLVLMRGGNVRNNEEMTAGLYELLNRIDDDVIAGRRGRRRAAVNAVHASHAQRDRPSNPAPVAPDDEALLPGTMPHPRQVRSDDAEAEPSRSGNVREIPIFPTLDEVMEDEDDDLIL